MLHDWRGASQRGMREALVETGLDRWADWMESVTLDASKQSELERRFDRELYARLSALWDIALMRAAGATAEDASLERRIRAEIEVTSRAGSGLELHLLVWSRRLDESGAWAAIDKQWSPMPAGAPLLDEQVDLYLDRALADGAWLDRGLAELCQPASSRS